MTEHIANLLVYSTRYALGRRSYAPFEVMEAILSSRDVLRDDSGCREAIIRDIESRIEDNEHSPLPPEIEAGWLKTLLFVKSIT